MSFVPCDFFVKTVWCPCQVVLTSGTCLIDFYLVLVIGERGKRAGVWDGDQRVDVGRLVILSICNSLVR